VNAPNVKLFLLENTPRLCSCPIIAFEFVLILAGHLSVVLLKNPGHMNCPGPEFSLNVIPVGVPTDIYPSVEVVVVPSAIYCPANRSEAFPPNPFKTDIPAPGLSVNHETFFNQ